MKHDVNSSFGKMSWQDLVSNIEPNNFCLLIEDSDNYTLMWGEEDRFDYYSDKNNWSEIQNFIDKHERNHIWTNLNYDLKNEIDSSLKSNNTKYAHFPEACFIVPKHVLLCRSGKISTSSDLSSFRKRFEIKEKLIPLELSPIQSEQEYIHQLELLLAEIQFGNIYEINYCTAFVNNNCQLEPLQSFNKLVGLTQAPHSVFMKIDSNYLLCGSPERYIRKTGNILQSQPIKGTARRSQNEKEDIQIKYDLKNDPKEISENIMIVDLVRNDLSKVASKNTVRVKHLNELHTFKSVHQLISTIECRLSKGASFSDIISATFPMGSMTGAPKKSAMQLSEKHEEFSRNLYSGSVGLIQPNGDFDLNVVIRSALYNDQENQLMIGVGGAITALSDPKKEYQECLIKLKAVKESLCSRN